MRLSTRTAVSLVAAAAVGFGGCSSSGSEPDVVDPEPAGGDTVPQPVGPTFQTDGVPQGWRRDPEGARGAAMSAVRLSGEVARAGFITRGDMIRLLSSERFGDELIDRTDTQLGELSEALGDAFIVSPQLTWHETPLTAEVVEGDDQRAVIEVWSVVVLATPDAGVPRQLWRTVEIELVWEDHDWKVDEWDSWPGPTPALAPAEVIAATEEVIEVTEWPTATVPPDGES